MTLRKQVFWLALAALILWQVWLRTFDFIDCFFHYTRHPILLNSPSSVSGWCVRHVALWPLFF